MGHEEKRACHSQEEHAYMHAHGLEHSHGHVH